MPAEPALLPAFAVARERARHNLETPEGKKYDEALAAFSGHKDARDMRACEHSVAAPDLRSVSLVVKATADGIVTEALVHPETNVSTCFKERWKAPTLPKPPGADYWVLLEMNLGR